jgi:hypothetical protein
MAWVQGTERLEQILKTTPFPHPPRGVGGGARLSLVRPSNALHPGHMHPPLLGAKCCRSGDKIFYIVKAQQEKLDALGVPEFKVDAKGGATLSWRKFDSIEAAWSFVKLAILP